MNLIENNITAYSLDFILNYGNSYHDILGEEFLQDFLEIKQKNRFSPKNFSKSFNYTNWKTSISKEEEAEINEEEIIIQKIIGTLNKLSESNFEKLKIKLWEFVELKESRIKVLIDNIFSMAIIQPIFCQNYAKLCIYLKDELEKNYDEPEINIKLSQIKIKNIILEKCQQLYIQQNNLEKTVNKNEYDKFCEIIKQKKQFTGSFQLVGELYLVDMIQEETIWRYFELIFSNLESGEKELQIQYTPCLKSFILTVGNKLSITKSDKISDLVSNITNYSKNTDKFGFKERFVFMDILDFIRKGYKN